MKLTRCKYIIGLLKSCKITIISCIILSISLAKSLNAILAGRHSGRENIASAVSTSHQPKIAHGWASQRYENQVPKKKKKVRILDLRQSKPNTISVRWLVVTGVGNLSKNVYS